MANRAGVFSEEHRKQFKAADYIVAMPDGFKDIIENGIIFVDGWLCSIDSGVTRVAWLNRSSILYAGKDKWSLDPRVVIVTNSKTEYSIQIVGVDVYDEGPYTCSVQTHNHPRTSRVHIIVQVPPKIVNISSSISVNEGSNVTLMCLAIGRPEPTVTWRHLSPPGLCLDCLAFHLLHSSKVNNRKLLSDVEPNIKKIHLNIWGNVSVAFLFKSPQIMKQIVIEYFPLADPPEAWSISDKPIHLTDCPL
ncbi:hypothetical protein chiPu_0001673 [Chiloscyllium punctatum]|uniref:Ig-like domain-containing protein n=1 Tax=Chiloscyllium punctatum TaxID=137246 RepID=A0A401RYU2_CHIPU|nr:hypothetical protein [Chiloscyllium punctatum]